MTDELFRFSWKKIVIILLIGIAIFLLAPRIIGLKQTLELLKQVKYWAFLLALFSEAFFYIGSAIVSRTVLRMTGDKLKFTDVLRIAVLDSFSVQFLPLGSFGEAAVDYYFYREKKIRTSHIVLLFIARTIIVYLIFAAIYLVGVAFSPTNTKLGPNKLMIVWLIYVLAFILFFYLISLYFRKDMLILRAKNVARIFNRISRLLRVRGIPLEKIETTIDSFYEAMQMLGKSRNLQLQAAGGALIFWFGDIFCLYFSLLGFGYYPHFAIVIFAYTIARILSLISFLPGGIGVAEGSLVLILIGFGAPATAAVAGVLIFRFLSFWLPIPIGLFSFLSLGRKYNAITKEEQNAR